MDDILQTEIGGLRFEWHGTTGWVGGTYIDVYDGAGQAIDAINTCTRTKGPAGNHRVPFTEAVFSRNIADWRGA